MDDIQKKEKGIFTAREAIIKTLEKLYSQRIPGTDKKSYSNIFLCGID